MKRRDFLRLGGFLTASVATLGVTGCVFDDDSNGRTIPAPVTGAGWQFPQSIASADPQPDSVILWTRVVPPSIVGPTASSSTDIAIHLRVTEADNSSALGSNTPLVGALIAGSRLLGVTVPAYAEFDNTVRHKLTGLEPGKVYYYQFMAGTELSKVGRFKTAPAATESQDVKFIFISCQDWSANHWAAFSQMVADDTTPANPDIDFVVHLGDYIYETDAYSSNDTETSHTAPVLPAGATLPGDTSKYAVELADYRYLYKLYRSDPRIQAVHERFPMIAVWDDHEFSDDSWQASETYTNTNNSQQTRRRNANQAWFEFMPADISFSAADTSFQNIRIYRDLKFGSVMHLIMTDERLYKSDHLIAETTLNPPVTGAELGRINSRYLAPEETLKYIENVKAAATTDPLSNISILGSTQRQWWKNTMSSSTSTWKIWGNEVSLLRMGLNGTNAVATLISVYEVPSLITEITNTAASTTSGNTPKASAIVGATRFGADATVAASAADAIAISDSGGGTDSDKTTAAINAGLTATQAAVAVSAFNSGQSGTTEAAETIAYVFMKADVQAYTVNSIIFINSFFGSFVSLVSPFFKKFMLNADQWDGYRRERADLMNHLHNYGIKNVVAVTGDIHAFFAGQVYNEFPGEILTVDGAGKEASSSPVAPASLAGTPVMVDLVTAGVSSTSWLSYIKEAADALDPFNALIGRLVYMNLTVPASGALPSFVLSLNLLDYTMGRAISAINGIAASQLADQLTDQLKRTLADLGVPEGNIDSMAATYISDIAATASDPASTMASAVRFAQQFSALGLATNPWLAHIDTEAQGYAIVTASPGSLACRFRKVNPLVGTVAPSSGRIIQSDTVATITAGSTTLALS